MPPNTKTTRPTSFHALGCLSIPNEQGKTYVVERGQELKVTEKMLAASLDRNGDTWLDLIDNPSAQIERWGEVKLAGGPCPFTVTVEPSGLYVRQKEKTEPYVYPETYTVTFAGANR